MPAVTPFYLRDAVSTVRGALPGELSLSATHPFATALNTSGGPNGAGNRSLDASAGTTVTALSGLINVNTAAAIYDFLGRWVSPYLGAQVIGAGNWVVRAALAHTVPGTGAATATGWGAVLKLWRPSTGAVVGTIFDSATAGAGAGGASPTYVDISTTIAGAAVTAIAGDVLVLEVWARGTNTSASSTAQMVMRYDGATVGSTTDTAATLTPPAAITTLSVVSPGITQSRGKAITGGRPEPETNSNPIAVRVLVNWNGDGTTFVDESHYCRGVSTSRGRQSVNDQFGAGSATARLRNIEGRFSPLNPSSPLYGSVVPRRAVQATVSYHGVTYPLFVGSITEDGQNTLAAAAEVNLNAFDAFDEFRLGKSVGAAQLGVRTDQAIGAILDAYGWPAAARSLDPGRQLQLFAPQAPTLAALLSAAQQELPGRLFIDRSGNVRFEAASTRPNVPIYAMLTSVESMQLGMRASDLVDSVDVSFSSYYYPPPPLAPPADVVLWTYATAPQLLGYGSTTIKGSFAAPGAMVVYPPVPTTDYPATLQLTAFSYDATGFSATLYNPTNYTQSAVLQVRGKQIQGQPQAQILHLEPTASGIEVNQAASLEAPWVQDSAAVGAWAQARIDAMSRPQPRPVITLAAKSPALTHLILGAELGDRIWLRDVGEGRGAGPWLSGLDQQFFIESIQLNLQFEPPQIVTATWSLFPYLMGVTG